MQKAPPKRGLIQSGKRRKLGLGLGALVVNCRGRGITTVEDTGIKQGGGSGLSRHGLGTSRLKMKTR